MAEEIDIAFLMKVIAKRAVAFFRDDLHMNVSRITHGQENVQKFQLRHITSLLAMDGGAELYLAFSFDKPLIEHAFERYSEDIEVAEDEREKYIEETAGDIINIIVGNATGSLSSQNRPVTLSPPVVISEAQSIFRHKDAQFYTACLETDHGKMDICCIGPKELFDEQFQGLCRKKY
jgi:CheY-specific phosphatase CheX